MYPLNANFPKNKVLLREFVLFWWRCGSLLKSEERLGTVAASLCVDGRHRWAAVSITWSCDIYTAIQIYGYSVSGVSNRHRRFFLSGRSFFMMFKKVCLHADIVLDNQCFFLPQWPRDIRCVIRDSGSMITVRTKAVTLHALAHAGVQVNASTIGDFCHCKKKKKKMGQILSYFQWCHLYSL